MYWYKNMPDRQSYEDLKYRDSPSAALQRTFIEFLILLFLLAIAYVIFSGFNYMDLKDQCFIKVRYDVLRGDRNSIIEGLKRLKKEDYVFYRKFCANVNQIYEKRCTETNPINSDVKFIESDGCYIKGSHAILIKPLDNRYSDKESIRIKDIKKYGEMAINYWYYEEPQLFEIKD